MCLRLEQEDGSLITHIVLEAGRRISDDTCGLNDVYPPDDLHYSTHLTLHIYIRHVS